MYRVIELEMYKIIEIIYLFILFIMIKKIVIIIWTNMKYKHIYLHYIVKFDKKMNKELFIINSYFQLNKSIKSCRKFITSTKYDKKIKNIKLYKNKCKVVSKFKKEKRKILVAVHSHISLYKNIKYTKIFNYYFLLV